MTRLHRALLRWKTRHRYLPRSLMGEAIDYALNQWSLLLHFLEDGQIEIDNNPFDSAQGRLRSGHPRRSLGRPAQRGPLHHHREPFGKPFRQAQGPEPAEGLRASSPPRRLPAPRYRSV